MVHEAEPVVIYHNPGCGTSRKVLELIAGTGIEPQVVRYLQAGWTAPLLKRLLDALAMKPHALLREGAAANLFQADDAVVIAAMVSDPSIVQRPIVTTAKGAALCRPAERVRAIL